MDNSIRIEFMALEVFIKKMKDSFWGEYGRRISFRVKIAELLIFC